MPPTLTPTLLQRQMPHPAWIDVVPSAKLRDSLILATERGEYDEQELCMDVLGALYGNCGDEGGELKGVLVWGEPWDVRGWEVSKTFVRKWGDLFAVWGELLESSNCWRVKRGERPLKAVQGRVLEVEVS